MLHSSSCRFFQYHETMAARDGLQLHQGTMGALRCAVMAMSMIMAVLSDNGWLSVCARRHS